MSRIGKKPISVPQGVKVNIADKVIKVEGPKGKMDHAMPACVSVELKDNILQFKGKTDSNQDKALLGTTRALVLNMIKGVTDGYSRTLEIVGVGFRATVQQNKLNLQIGFTHPIDYIPPEGVKVEAPKQTLIVVSGSDKAKVGQAAAEIRDFRPPEPYKGKGIRYQGEHVRKKLGKAIAKTGAGGAG